MCLLSLFPLYFFLVLNGHISRQELFSEHNALCFCDSASLLPAEAEVHQVLHGTGVLWMLALASRFFQLHALIEYFLSLYMRAATYFITFFHQKDLFTLLLQTILFLPGCISAVQQPVYKLAFVPKCLKYCSVNKLAPSPNY